HAQVVEPHNSGTADSLDDLVLLQKAAEGVVQVALLRMPVPGHFERHQGPCRLALPQIQIRHRSCCNAANVTITANECATETLRVAARGTRSPHRASERLPLLAGGQDLDQLAMRELVVRNDLDSERNRLVRDRITAAQQDQGRETYPGSQLLRPRQATAP